LPVLAPDHNLLCVAVPSRLKVLLISSSATFAAAKNKKEVKTKLAKQDFDFLYDQKKVGSTSTRMEQTKDLAMMASLPFSKVLLI
jgi:hypothetical protein